MKHNIENGLVTWCLCICHYGSASTMEKETHCGDQVQFCSKEKEALVALMPMLLQFGGKVNLLEPNVMLYVFDGLAQNMTVLNRRMVTGPKTLTINPNTHICITNTMLCPIASFNMCNVAGITAGSNHFGSLCGVQWQPLGCGHARTNFCHSWY